MERGFRVGLKAERRALAGGAKILEVDVRQLNSRATNLILELEHPPLSTKNGNAGCGIE